MISKRLILTFFFALLSLTLIRAQSDFEQLIKGGKDDANYLAKGYVSPMLKAIGTGLNQGWYNTAKPHNRPRKRCRLPSD